MGLVTCNYLKNILTSTIRLTSLANKFETCPTDVWCSDFWLNLNDWYPFNVQWTLFIVIRKWSFEPQTHHTHIVLKYLFVDQGWASSLHLQSNMISKSNVEMIQGCTQCGTNHKTNCWPNGGNLWWTHSFILFFFTKVIDYIAQQISLTNSNDQFLNWTNKQKMNWITKANSHLKHINIPETWMRIILAQSFLQNIETMPDETWLFPNFYLKLLLSIS